MLQGVSGDPLLGFTRDSEKSLKVIETERSPIARRPGLIFERPRKSRREERTLFADILPDRRFGCCRIAAWLRVCCW